MVNYMFLGLVIRVELYLWIIYSAYLSTLLLMTSGKFAKTIIALKKIYLLR
jgi:hypothetical protein